MSNIDDRINEFFNHAQLHSAHNSKDGCSVLKDQLYKDIARLIDTEFSPGKTFNETQFDIHKKLNTYFGRTE